MTSITYIDEKKVNRISSDVYEECLRAGEIIPLDRLTDINELETKLDMLQKKNVQIIVSVRRPYIYLQKI